MAEEPIDVRPGVYTEPGKPPVMGLCIVIDNQNGEWDVAETDDEVTIVTIKKGAKWRADEYPEPGTTRKKVQIFCEGGNLNSIVLKHFIHPTEDVHTPDDNPPAGEVPELKIHYTSPRGDG